jgi:hypothetical protein
MKIIFYLCLLCLINLILPDQKVRTIRFVYSGEESKPRGTLLISVGKYIRPYDNPVDSLFGLGLKTDEKTFKVIDSFVRTSKDVMLFSRTISDTVSAYNIIGPTGIRCFLPEAKFEAFFSGLREDLQDQQLDKSVAIALKYYYSSWHR